MQFKAIIIALAAVGSAVASPLDLGAQAPSAQEIMDQASAFAKAQCGKIPDAAMIKAAQGLKTTYSTYAYCQPQYNSFPCADSCDNGPQPWGYWDYFNAYCYQQYPTQYEVWNNWCFNPTIQVNTCSGLLGCLLQL
ncbi:hypothetical protein AC579_1208 [Pseudocercospora musae]|uniref:Uncharacterized protein n=1 Tax=Pseudocercospora musae TaxID=113226 RepID=A0A139HZF9_9PEZI|nr:hypothetical protein AC579_1208 [Pseudocercospora musae]